MNYKKLAFEASLYEAFKKTGKAVLVCVAITQSRQGCPSEKIFIYYHDTKIFKERPFFAVSEYVVADMYVRFTSLDSAKRMLRGYYGKMKIKTVFKSS